MSTKTRTRTGRLIRTARTAAGISHVWLPQGCLDWRDQAQRERWSFERRCNALIAATEVLPPPTAGELEAMAAEVAELEAKARQGWRIEKAMHDSATGESGTLFVREDRS
jgi:hypothetical protein